MAVAGRQRGSGQAHRGRGRVDLQLRRVGLAGDGCSQAMTEYADGTERGVEGMLCTQLMAIGNTLRCQHYEQQDKPEVATYSVV